jgi:hypothetical protein
MVAPFGLPDDIVSYISCDMKATQKAIRLLEKMGKIDRMERGKLCQMKGREHFNHQTWQNGRNNVRYVPREEAEDLQAAIDGYARFNELARQYIDEIVRLTRLEHARRHPKRTPRTTASRPTHKKAPRNGPD